MTPAEIAARQVAHAFADAGTDLGGRAALPIVWTETGPLNGEVLKVDVPIERDARGKVDVGALIDRAEFAVFGERERRKGPEFLHARTMGWLREMQTRDAEMGETGWAGVVEAAEAYGAIEADVTRGFPRAVIFGGGGEPPPAWRITLTRPQHLCITAEGNDLAHVGAELLALAQAARRPPA